MQNLLRRVEPLLVSTLRGIMPERKILLKTLESNKLFKNRGYLHNGLPSFARIGIEEETLLEISSRSHSAIADMIEKKASRMEFSDIEIRFAFAVLNILANSKSSLVLLARRESLEKTNPLISPLPASFSIRWVSGCFMTVFPLIPLRR